MMSVVWSTEIGVWVSYIPYNDRFVVETKWKIVRKLMIDTYGV